MTIHAQVRGTHESTVINVDHHSFLALVVRVRLPQCRCHHRAADRRIHKNRSGRIWALNVAREPRSASNDAITLPLSAHLSEAPDAVKALVVLCATVLLARRATTPITVVVGRRPVFRMLWMVIFTDVAEWNGHSMPPRRRNVFSGPPIPLHGRCTERSFTGEGQNANTGRSRGLRRGLRKARQNESPRSQ
jgi:hypothetical protein